ncbi:GNAT family N-acetyltransferase [Aurantimonas sp. MSK8Z-1]|uniref:GNAT family N-acetyltransferase n=1 Tax=Mangrovibrevibacter kandeliae TaxID=2968473 RepID=UPI002117C9E9|nr:GNAT family N-acetyltransferase [Aurantimonas sp. MSK8Z-1]MCW4114909.1 GNAT family N-acetyltransferase [Aurantimonas sp. MSK8Z-1]
MLDRPEPQLVKARVTYLELRRPPARALSLTLPGHTLALFRVPDIPLAYYRFLYDSVGRPHHWTSRRLPDQQLSAIIHADPVRVYVLYCDGAPAGWFELDTARSEGETRLVHFAVMPEFRGFHLAPLMLSHAIAAGLAARPQVFSLETNSLDHKAALPLYQRFGFEPVSTRDVWVPALTG